MWVIFLCGVFKAYSSSNAPMLVHYQFQFGRVKFHLCSSAIWLRKSLIRPSALSRLTRIAFVWGIYPPGDWVSCLMALTVFAASILWHAFFFCAIFDFDGRFGFCSSVLLSGDIDIDIVYSPPVSYSRSIAIVSQSVSRFMKITIANGQFN